MQRIKELRKEKSMNQIALGMELNFSQKIISEYENGKVEPSITTLKKLASIFNTSVDYKLNIRTSNSRLTKLHSLNFRKRNANFLTNFVVCQKKNKTLPLVSLWD